MPHQPKQSPKPTGTLTVPREIAERWLPWFEDQVADFKRTKLIGENGFISQICKAARTKWDAIGDAKEITFKNMTASLVEALTDFHRRAYGHSNAPIFYALGAGWRGPGQVEQEVPAEELQRCLSELEKPYVAPTFVPASERKEVKPVGSLF